MRDPGFLAWLSAVTGIPKLLYDGEYGGGGTLKLSPARILTPTSISTTTPTGTGNAG
ncbi:MAG: hypothetical protein O3A53_16340 [Acidobacteria bacterium]|nr:hypothetical protein [Acidobacteriota bacterium]